MSTPDDACAFASAASLASGDEPPADREEQVELGVDGGEVRGIFGVADVERAHGRLDHRRDEGDASVADEEGGDDRLPPLRPRVAKRRARPQPSGQCDDETGEQRAKL